MQEVRKGATAKLNLVEGDLKVGKKAKIEALKGKSVVVSGAAYFEGAALVDASFECDSLTVKHGGALKVNGDLVVHKLLDALHVIDARGYIRAGEIDVGGRVAAYSILCEKRVRVGGVLDIAKTLEAKTVDIGGKVTAGGAAKIGDLNVGGAAVLKGGGSILGDIMIGGKFEARGSLEFGNLEILGRIFLPAGSKGKKISAYGKLSAEGDLDCDEIDLKGVMGVRGSCKSNRINSSGKIDVRGSLECESELTTIGTADIRGHVRASNLRIGGKFRSGSVVAKDRLEIEGHAQTRNGMKGSTIIIASGSSCSGVLVGENIDVGKSYGIISDWSKSFFGQSAALRLIARETRLGEIYASFVRLGRSSRCAKIVAEVVELEEGCKVDELVYSKELKGSVERSTFARPPRKVSDLPNPPEIAN
jgi:cytoskeletal protein CcmA (bactofilin family)